MSKKWRLVGSAVLLSVLAWKMDWARVAEAFGKLDVRFWLLAFVLYVITQVTSAWRWQLMARALGLTGTWREYLSYYFVGMFFNLVLPTSVGGDVARAWYLSRQPASVEAPRMTAVISVLADRISGVIVLAGVACAAAFFAPVAMPPWIVASVAIVGAGAVGGVIGLPLVDRILHSRRFESPRFERPRRLVAGGMLILRHGRLMVITTLLSIVVQVNNVVTMGLVGLGLGLQIPFLYYGVVMPLVALLTMLPISINGLGLREASTVLLLQPLGISTAEAVTLAFLVFAVQTATGLCGIGFYLFGNLPRFSAKRSAEPRLPEQANAAERVA